MSERPARPPEGALIAAAIQKKGLSAREAAKRAGMSEGRWRQIVNGYQTVSGQHVAVTGPKETVARMARVADITPDRLAEAGREDAALYLRELLRDEQESSDGDGGGSDDNERSHATPALENILAALRQEMANLHSELRETRGEVRETRGEVREANEKIDELHERLGGDPDEGGSRRSA